MKKTYILSLLIITLIVIEPISLLSRFYLKNSSGDIFYTFFNIFYAPNDYYNNIIWGGMLTPNEKKVIVLDYEYLGIYDLYISGNATKNPEITYSIKINCLNGRKLSFDSNEVHATDLLRKNSENLQVGSFEVSTNSKKTEKCTIEYITKEDSQIYVFIKKSLHW